MQFMIQAGNPRTNKRGRFATAGIGDAMSLIFPIYTEHALMVWQDVCIPISYGNDIGYMMEDILVMIRDLSEECKGMRHISWMPHFFKSRWTVRWNERNVWIMSRWENVLHASLSRLNSAPDIMMNKNDFIAEWKMILLNTLNGLDECGYDGNNLEGYSAVLEVYNSMKQFGRLYRTEQ